MKLRQLVSATGLYGIADMLVVGVSGFLLLPLYTRALPQDEFGAYVIIKANTEIFGYVLYFGLVSAASRLYFDYRDTGRPREYMNALLMFFLAVAVGACAILALVGNALWELLSPSIPAQPYLWYTMALVIAGFMAQLGALWLRLDQRVHAFVILQVMSAVLLAGAAWISLVVLEQGLPGLMMALLLGFVPASLMLFYGIGKRLRPSFDRAMIGPSLHYGVPFAITYIAYFVLNRFSLMTLQHHVTLEDIAIFGLAQQIALVIAVGSQSFGKAMQPAVFGAAPEDVPEMLRRSSRLFILLIFGVAALAIIFARELLWLVAPSGYGDGLAVVLVLLVASFIYSLCLVSNTAIDYHRRPRTQAAVSIFGAILAVVLGLVLIPRFGLMGGAIATLGAFLGAALASHVVAYRLTGQSYFTEIATVTTTLVGLALLAAWPGWNGVFLPAALAAKLVVSGVAFAILLALFAPQRFAQAIARIRRALP